MRHRHHALGAFVRIVVVVVIFVFADQSSAFLTPSSTNNINKFTTIGRPLSNNNNGGDPVFFDDFGDGFFDGSSSSPSSNSNLSSRISQVKGAEAAYDAKMARNWRRGNWGVRGFALDQFSTSQKTPSEDAIHVSIVTAPTSSSFSDISLPQDRALPEDRTVAVGRTDGSIFIVKLGDQYLTNFVSAPKLVVETEGSADGGGQSSDMSVRVENEWVDLNQVKKSMQDEQYQTPTSPLETECNERQMPQEQNPFEIVCQFQASEHSEPVHALVYHDSMEEGNCDGIICAASGLSGDISMWTLPNDQNNGEVVQTNILSGVHKSEVIALGTMVLRLNDTKEQNVLYSVSRDGFIALWDVDKNGKLMYHSQCTDVVNDSSVLVSCADASNPTAFDDGYSTAENGKDVLFLGTSNGYVLGYVVQDILESGAPESPMPSIRFRAHGPDNGSGEAVTAMKCGGDGTIPTSLHSDAGQGSGVGRNPRLSSSILLTGGEDGSVKQW